MFKKRFTEIALAVAMTMSAGAAQAVVQDIAVNGGFETGDFSGWALFPGSAGPAGQTVSNVNPSSGTYSGQLTELSPAANIIKQANLRPGEWTPGQSIDIQFDIRGTAAAGGVLFAEFFNELAGGGVGAGSGILGGGPLFPNANSDVWTTHNFSVVAGSLIDTAGGITLQFNSACAPIGGCIADYFIDNVSITADLPAAVPVPAAVWLFGSGLVGLVGVARRRKG